MLVFKAIVRIGLTLFVVTSAIFLAIELWQTYMLAPWTRDGRVRVYVVDIAPEVEGTVVRLPVVDNQYVHKGDPLFVLDPVRFRIAVRAAQASLDRAEEQLKINQRNSRRRMGLGGIVSAEEQENFNTTAAISVAEVNAARANLDKAKIDLQRSVLYSPVNGYVTNLNLRVGDFVTVGQRRLAVIDSDSFWVNAYFEETKMWGVHVGDAVRVKLMGYKQIIPGHVVSIARGINDQNSNPDGLGLQDVNPIFTWVRLAQRIPVRVHLDHVPETIALTAGMTATVVVGPEDRNRRGWLTTWLQYHL
ncbi:HlyD family efflux transporter periplasmic adaptor subunit [Entomobacter blattae]|uniref:p-hydroxybenzoic acid efflux pump subunit AaeA n=1 Tax=Entomobacter blattae TaxID=2762277 RepID=A0A7H1NPI4_9PROT|nr:HlyD family secretion protein [Entomobacter blattae]QNT77694.1 p-hydroxybenzoic acid efflux pump subunit AaeA [Entomobacter blattae]